MEKIKSLFRPGGDADDNVMYGTPEPKNTHAQGGSHDHESVGPAMLQTDPASETGNKQGGVMKQILNPGGHKYDEERYGTTAHSDKPLNMPTSGTSFGTDSNLAPGSGTSSTLGGGLPDRTLQSNETGGRSFPLSGGSTSGSAVNPSQSYGADDSLRQGSSSTGHSHLGRDAGLGAGAGALGAGALAHERREQSGGLNDLSSTSGTTGHSHHDRDGALGSGTGALGAGALSRETPSYNDPSSYTGTSGSNLSGTRDSGLTGSGLSGSGLTGSHGTSGGLSGAHIPGDSLGYHRPDETPVPGYVHHVPGPHATDIANILDPHVPGEFPTATGGESHLGRDAGIGGAGLGAAGLAGYEANKHSHGHSSNDPLSSSSLDRDGRDHSSHLGRDAGIGGAGLGAAGLAGYEANKHSHGHSSNDPLSSSSLNRDGLDRSSHTGSGILPSSSTSRNELPVEGSSHHHHGRDATLAGGAGAAGLGAYEAEKRHGQTFSSTSAVDPSSHNQSLNALENFHAAEFQNKGETPGSSTHHHGRDAALVGGTGAAGLGAYEAEKRHGQTSGSAVDPSSNNRSLNALENFHAAEFQNKGEKPSSSTHHHGRDAALVGGAGAAGVGAYEAEKKHDHTHGSSTGITTGSPEFARREGYAGETQALTAEEAQHHYGRHAARGGSTTEPAHEHHLGRDAAIAGGAGTVGLGAYEAERRHENKHENVAPVAASHHDHNKLQKSNDKHEKELEKAREHEAAKHGEKKEGFMHKLLHPGNRDKSADHGLDEHERAMHEKNARERGHEEVIAPGATQSGLNESALVSEGSNAQFRAPDGTLDETFAPGVGMAQHNLDQTSAHGLNQHELTQHGRNEHDRAIRGEEPLATGVLAGGHNTGSTSGIGSTSGHNTGSTSGIVTEPHTGLPMNVGKYGSGQGGVDGSSNIPGYHETNSTLR